ncbi:MAG: hypothetical protein DRI37_00330 [Chloroflexi bacterium]|nr:MAG: hypothetical protein DRI37_00330 [Chloroflexota bacterium]
MEKSRPVVVTLVAILQFIPILLLPPELLLSINPVLFLIPLAFFVFLGWAMLTFKRWALTLCIFVHGFNVLVRFLILFPQASNGESINWPFVITSLASILLSTIILYVIDRPKIQVAFKA